jgi:predicted DNA-binding protein with PD1-like motif
MTFAAERSSSARHLVLRAAAGDALPAALVAALRAENVKRGWLRATGVLEEVHLRPLTATGTATGTRTLAGPVHLLHLDAPIEAEGNDLEIPCRGVVAFDGDRGYETIGAQIVSARIRTMDVLVTVLEDPVAARTWAAAIEASARPETPPPSGAPAGASSRGAGPPVATGAAAMPPRPLRPTLDLDGLVPDAGDTVEHFAFGRGDVVKSDGDRLHVRTHKDGRIREIALEMLRVSLLEGAPEAAGARHFKLERRL